MAKIYAVADIHGHLDILKETMKRVELSGDNKLIFLGDYIDSGPSSKETLEYIFNLQKQYPNQIVALKGNHEEWFIDWLENEIEIAYFQADKDFATLKTFLKSNQLGIIANYLQKGKSLFEVNDIIKKYIKANCPELISWVKKLPVYYETENQIFVHAGVDEEAGEFWRYGTDDSFYTSKYPPTVGAFYKDIIAGHTGTSFFTDDKNFHDIFFDGKSHYYIDGTVEISKRLNLLVYDTEEKSYSFM